MGVYDFGGRLTTSMTAHPKIDPATGQMHFFGYGFVPPFLTYHVADADGTLVHEHRGARPWAHDDPRLRHHRDRRGVLGPAGGVRPRGGRGHDRGPHRRRVPVPLGSVLRRAHRRAARSAPTAPRSSGPRSSPATCSTASTPSGRGARWSSTSAATTRCSRAGACSGTGWPCTAGPSTRRPGRATDVEVDERSDMELPSRDTRRTGREHRHGYFVQNRPAEGTVDLGGVIKHDYRTGDRQVWEPGPTEHGGRVAVRRRRGRRGRRRGLAAQLPPRRGQRRQPVRGARRHGRGGRSGRQRRPAAARALRLPRHLGVGGVISNDR